MKLKFIEQTRHRLVARTHNGTTHQVREPYQVSIPKPPADWDARAIKGASILVLMLTMVSVVWSTYSIGHLLDGGVGFLAAAVFDLAWLVNVLLEWLSRFDAEKRRFSQYLGWALLAATMGAILWEGLDAGSAGLAVVGAAVSAFAKVLWLGIMRFVERDLSPADREWVAQEVSAANAKMAIASVRRMSARAEAAATMELLAAERMRTELADVVAEHAPALAATLTGTPAAVAQAAQQPAAIAPAVTPAGLAELVAALSGPVATAVSARLSGPVDNEPMDADIVTDTAAAVRPDNSAVRPATVIPQFIAPDIQESVLPDDAGRPADDQDDDEADAAPAGHPVSPAKVIRELLSAGVEEKRLLELVPLAIGRKLNDESVKREIRRQKGVLAAKADQGTEPEPLRTGQYL
ncbi:hypothetical protein [Kitasatospora sp. MBT66]|uniref:hypothetical protein n=1 Tax=Kitasatospora sp. MBT66 TaxID=1444769 RepID=UPI0006897E0D|nr:hypothetical protein [Kitasatospora sp. MBT66]